jgi:hypothetical protein
MTPYGYTKGTNGYATNNVEDRFDGATSAERRARSLQTRNAFRTLKRRARRASREEAQEELEAWAGAACVVIVAVTLGLL